MMTILASLALATILVVGWACRNILVTVFLYLGALLTMCIVAFMLASVPAGHLWQTWLIFIYAWMAVFLVLMAPVALHQFRKEAR